MLVFKDLVKAVAVKKAGSEVSAPLNPTPGQVVVLAKRAVEVAKLRGLLVQAPSFNIFFVAALSSKMVLSNGILSND